MNRDRNLLFGVLALQLGKITSTQLVDAAGSWALDPTRSLPRRLVEIKAITDADRDLIERLVDDAISAHGGDAAATMASFGGEQQILRSFQGSIALTDSGGVTRVSDSLPFRPVTGETSTIGVAEEAGRYTGRSEYARGGMGRVLIAHDEHLGRSVAIKELLPEFATKAKMSPVSASFPFVSRFLQEARVTGQLEHPSIVPVYELGHRTDGSLYYTMKLVRGRTLSQAIHESRSMADRLKLLPHFIDLCQALAYAHNRGVIHRDLKPGNVMVGEFGETVVLDWGLAKIKGMSDAHADGLAETLRVMNLGDEQGLAATQYGQAIGTPVYMPPEQAKGFLEQIDERSDVYSLGAVLYELLTGTTPFSGLNIESILHQVIAKEPEPIAAIAPAAPPELAAIAMRALSKDPANRYQSARDLAEEIIRFQSGAMVSAYSYTAGEYVRRYVRKHKAIFATATAALAVLVGFAVYYNVQLRAQNASLERAQIEERKQRIAAQEAEQRAVAALETVARQSYTGNVLIAQRAIEEGRSKLAIETLWATDPAQRHFEWSHLLESAYEMELGRDPYEATYGAEVSPDGRLMAYGMEDGTVRLIHLQSGQFAAELKGHTAQVETTAFSGDGSRIATAGFDKTIRVWDVVSGAMLATMSGHAEAVMAVAFSPNGERVLTASLDKTCRMWDAATGAEVFVMGPYETYQEQVGFSPDGQRIVSWDKGLVLSDVATGKTLFRLPEVVPNTLAWGTSAEGAFIAGVLKNGERLAICHWNATTGAQVAEKELSPGTTVHGPTASGTDLVVSNAGRIELMEMATMRLRVSVDAGAPSVEMATVDASGQKLVAALGSEREEAQTRFMLDGSTGEVRQAHIPTSVQRIAAWSIGETETAKWSMEVPNQRIRSIAFGPQGDCVLLERKTYPMIVDWETGRQGSQNRIRAHRANVARIEFSPDGSQLFTSSWDGSARVWDVARGVELGSMYSAVQGPILGVFLQAPETMGVFAQEARTLAHWDVSSGTVDILGCEEIHAVFCGGDLAVTARANKGLTQFTLVVWQMDTGEKIREIVSPVRVESLRASQSPGMIDVGPGDGTAVTFDPVSMRFGESFTLEPGIVALNSTLRVRIDVEKAVVEDRATGGVVSELVGHTSAIRLVDISGDSRRVFTLSDDNSVKLWDTATGTNLVTFVGPERGRLSIMRFEAGGRAMAYADQLGNLYIADVLDWASSRNGDANGDLERQGFKEAWANRARRSIAPGKELSARTIPVVAFPESIVAALRQPDAWSFAEQADATRWVSEGDVHGLRIRGIRDGWGEQMLETMEFAGFQPGDLLTGVNGVEATTEAEMFALLTSTSNLLESKPESEISLAIVREGSRRVLRPVYFPRYESEETVPVSRSELTALLTMLTMSAERAEGEMTRSFFGGPKGFQLGRDNLKYAERIGLTPDDIVYAINGVRLSSKDGAISALKELRRQASSADVATAAIDVIRQLHHRVSVTLVFK